jgi:hypothetical protein
MSVGEMTASIVVGSIEVSRVGRKVDQAQTLAGDQVFGNRHGDPAR